MSCSVYSVTRRLAYHLLTKFVYFCTTMHAVQFTLIHFDNIFCFILMIQVHFIKWNAIKFYKPTKKDLKTHYEAIAYTALLDS